MFESDDYDQVLSQFEFPDVTTRPDTQNRSNSTQHNVLDDTNISIISATPDVLERTVYHKQKDVIQLKESPLPIASPAKELKSEVVNPCIVSPKHTKRKMINSFFDHKTKRKFPGPAGLLNGSLMETKDENICYMELFSQDIDFSQNHLRKDLFESPLWMRMSQDIHSWNLQEIDSIKTIKQQAMSGNLRRRKAQTVTAFVETIDRSATDPLVILRDDTGTIKCTLHRDAWSSFSPYIVSEYCALVLWKPTVLTTGSAFKKHYLNITLNNIYAIYSSAVLKDEDDYVLPDGYLRINEENYTVIKTATSPSNLERTFGDIGQANGSGELLDDLDSIFCDDIF